MADSYNELHGLGSHARDTSVDGSYRFQDDAASTVLLEDKGGSSGTLYGGNNTNTISTTGPNSFALKALDLDGDNALVPCSDISAAGAVFCRFRIDSLVTGNQFLVCHRTAVSNSRLYLYFSDTSAQLIVGYGSAGAVGSSSTLTVGTWYDVALIWGGGTISLYLDGSLSVSGSATGYSGGWSGNINFGSFYQPGTFAQWLNCSVADALLLSGSVSGANAEQWRLGPEPLNTVAPTLNTDGTGSVGTWDSQGNGTITYLTTLYLASDDSTVATSTDASFDFSGDITGGETYYAVVEATNDGGSDPAEDQTTADVTMDGGGGFKSHWAINSTTLVGAGGFAA